jgi:hypothetical protein
MMDGRALDARLLRKLVAEHLRDEMKKLREEARGYRVARQQQRLRSRNVDDGIDIDQ